MKLMNLNSQGHIFFEQFDVTKVSFLMQPATFLV